MFGNFKKGQAVSGVYMGVAFAGTVRSVTLNERTGNDALEIDFPKPIEFRGGPRTGLILTNLGEGDSVQPATTAVLRKLASDAEASLDWARAAALYDAAADVYPPFHSGSQLSVRDVALLRDQARECRNAHNAEHMSDMQTLDQEFGCDPWTTPGHPAAR